MIERRHWSARIAAGWRQASIVWLSGVRRVGKTTLARAIPNARYFNCDLPSVQMQLDDPEAFYRQHSRGTIILDEVHQLADPSGLLKIGADTTPALKILATGSSTLAATAKFRDSLAGRKRSVVLLPVLWEELDDFGAQPDARLLRGGLPPALLSEPQPEMYAEWLDSYFARDVQELFRVEKRAGFLSLLSTILRQSGGLIEPSHLARSCGLSRPTIQTYLDVMETTHVIHVLRPFHGGSARELVHQPKVYGFDTGFVCHERGWDSLRAEDRGVLWEHIVLDALLAAPVSRVGYWRDKGQREIDFVVARGRNLVDAIECKWSPSAFDPRGLAAFRAIYPRGTSYLVVPHVEAPYERAFGALSITVIDPGSLRRRYR